MSQQISTTLDRLDTALTRLETERSAEHAVNPDSAVTDREAMAETEAMVEALRRDSMELMNQFQTHKQTTAQVAQRLDALIAQVRTVLGE